VRKAEVAAQCSQIVGASPGCVHVFENRKVPDRFSAGDGDRERLDVLSYCNKNENYTDAVACVPMW